MSTGAMTRRTSVAALTAAVLLVAANMRPTITSVGPVLGQIGDDTGMSPGGLGLLAAVPLLAWGAISPFAHVLSRRFGMSRVVLWSLVLLVVGTLVRSLPGPTVSLWLGTVLIGAALAVANVLLPAVIKRDFRRVPLVMALYTALLAGFGAVASGVAVPISLIGGPDSPAGWRTSLALIGCALPPFAILAWGWAVPGSIRGPRMPGLIARPAASAPPLTSAPPASAPSVTAARPRRAAMWRDGLAWQVAVYMGLQSASFYMLVTWLATISTSTGRSEVLAGIDVMLFQLFSLVGSILLPLVLRGRSERLVPALIPVLGVAGVVGLMVAPGVIDLWAAVIGLFSGSSLAMSLTLLAQRARDHDTSAALSGMAQSVGYFMAACGPVLFGWLHASTDGWTVPLALLLAAMVAQVVTGLFAGRDRFVLDPR
ncbi:MFS transporter [Microbacterium elymi]|uniref:MFS transporter n=1 Tax=Microbacterium elymi TaxID=2909587 RepID=A0ABY5NM53_9MICO|nr:MFS transporter [Microbacterium elymi]UUT36189.1 MFS transporter [Microbacterium elymi]